MDSCCLCSCSVAIGSFNKKRKQLYGRSCSQSRAVLERLTVEVTGQGLPAAETWLTRAFLCHVCDGKLISIEKHEEQLRVLKGEVADSIRLSRTPQTGESVHAEPQPVNWQKRGHEHASTQDLGTTTPHFIDPHQSSGPQGFSEVMQPASDQEDVQSSGSEPLDSSIQKQSPTVTVRYINIGSLTVVNCQNVYISP